MLGMASRSGRPGGGSGGTAVGWGVGVGCGVADGSGVGDGQGVREGHGVGDGQGVADGRGVGEGGGVRVGGAVGVQGAIGYSSAVPASTASAAGASGVALGEARTTGWRTAPSTGSGEPTATTVERGAEASTSLGGGGTLGRHSGNRPLATSAD